MEACNTFGWTAWLVLVALQATFCGSFVVPLQATTAWAKHKPGRYHRPAAAPPNLYPRSRPPAQPSTHRPAAVGGAAAPLRRPRTLLAPQHSRNSRAFPVLPLSVASENGATGSGGHPTGDCSSSSSSRPGDRATDDAPAGVVQAETERLMSVPTIDIKLELQMRGVEHRDAFEKVDLARRLAEARVSCPSPPGATPSAPGDDDDAAGAGGRPGTREPAKPTERPTSTEGDESEGAAPAEGNGERGGAAAGSTVYARDVSKAMRMGKAAVSRELNVMGVAHSRLSDAPVLARLYADGRRDAREAAGEARRFPRAVRSSQDQADWWGTGGRTHGDGEREGSGRGSGSGDEDERWKNTRENWGRVASGLPWNGGKKSKDEDNEEEGEGSGQDSNAVGESILWNEGRGDESSTAASFGDGDDGGDGDDDGDDDDGSGSETGWSVRANAGSVVASSSGGGGGFADNGRNREASLRARADRMSSRELMKALDDLGAQYRIPAQRLELQEAFVSAVLAEDARDQGGSGAPQGRERAEIVPVSPYAATAGEEDGLDEEAMKKRSGASFGTYHAALSWARQLNFDEVLEELECRGVTHNPRADFSYLTRLLADEVLADEERMEAEGAEGVYTAELRLVMAMTAQEIIRDLRAGGERVDVTKSKEALAEKLAEMNMRLRGDSLPDSGSSDAFYRQRRPGARGRAGAGAGAGASGDLLGHGGDGDGEDVLLELEEAAKSVGGAALLVAKETAAFVSQTAAGLFPNVFPDEGGGGRGTGSASVEEKQRRRMRRAGGTGGVGDDTQDGAQRRRARAVRERAGGVGKAATGFAQSSVNRAGFAVAQSVANGALKGAEAAADWAGDGALAREYVLLFIAAFCLVFKRGVGAAVALLVVIRFGRTTAQKLVSEGWKVEQQKRARAREGGDVAAAAGSDATSYRRDNPPVRYPAGAAADRRPRRRKASGAAKTEEKRRPRPRPRVNKNAKNAKRNPTRSRRPKKAARKPLWDSESEDDGRGCVVM